MQILKEVGAAEICKATKIASKNIHSILEKRYESLSRVHARGFIQILEREYKIDLSAWVKEFDKVCVFKEGVGEEQKQETSPEETAKNPLRLNWITASIKPTLHYPKSLPNGNPLLSF